VNLLGLECPDGKSEGHRPTWTFTLVIEPGPIEVCGGCLEGQEGSPLLLLIKFLIVAPIDSSVVRLACHLLAGGHESGHRGLRLH
jgi:hypothetical protein